VETWAIELMGIQRWMAVDGPHNYQELMGIYVAPVLSPLEYASPAPAPWAAFNDPVPKIPSSPRL
jgi:hypothetical protein